MYLGTNIENLKVRRHLTYEQIADAVGTSPASISQLHKRNSKMSTFAPQLAEYFDVPMEALTSIDFSNLSDGDIRALNVSYRVAHTDDRNETAEDNFRRVTEIVAMFAESDTEGRAKIYDAATIAARRSAEIRDAARRSNKG